MVGIVEQIIHAGDTQHPVFWDPDPGPDYRPPSLQEPLGCLLLTEGEIREVLDHFGIGVPTGMTLWGIPYQIVEKPCSEIEHLTPEEKS